MEGNPAPPSRLSAFAKHHKVSDGLKASLVAGVGAAYEQIVRYDNLALFQNNARLTAFEIANETSMIVLFDTSKHH